MITTAQKVFKDLETGNHKPLYLVVGSEPFQSSEILFQFKRKFVQGEISQALNFESWEGDGLNGSELLNSLDMLPGLFSTSEEVRLVVCHRFDKVAAAHLDLLQKYFSDPSSSTVFMMLVDKVDKRKSWYKAVEQNGDVIEIREPYDREWPKWLGYFEKKIEKRIEPVAWDMLVVSSGKCLSLLAKEVEKMAVYLGSKPTIQLADVQAMASYSGAEDVFSLVEDIAMRRKSLAFKKYESLMRSGESDIKILSLIVRQFKMIEHALRLLRDGISEPKTVASQIGAHPFFISKIFEQMKKYDSKSVGAVLNLLAQCDFQIKTGDGKLFDKFLVPFFATPVEN